MRKVLYILASLLFIALLTPYILSVQPFKGIIISKIESKLNAKVAIDQMQFRWFGPQTFRHVQISNADLDGTFESIVLRTQFWNIPNQPYSLAVINGHFSVHNGNTSSGTIEQINATIDGSNVSATGTTTANGASGSFSVLGTAVSADNFDLTFFADQMPTEPIDCLLGAKGDLLGMLGSTLSLTGTASNHSNIGSINAELSATTAKGSVTASFTPTVVTLEAPLSLTMRAPPSVVKNLSKKGLYLKDPISLYVSNEGFSFPRPFNLSKLHVGSGTLAVQRVAVPKPSGVDNLSVFLKSPQLANSKNIEICLTPADFSLNAGLLTLGRVDALIEHSLHLCCWGKVNLITESINATLGVPGDTLSQTLLVVNAPSNFCLQVPISGSYENPKFDTATASVQLAGIIASNQAQKAGGNFGVFGDIVGQAISTVSQPETTPPQKYSIPCQ